MAKYAARKDGVLIGQGEGREARHELERAIAAQVPGTAIAPDFKDVRSVSVPFADAFLVPLLNNRLTGYYDDHPFVVVNANPDVAETLAATLQRRNLCVLGLPGGLLGGDPALEETVELAQELRSFSALQIAGELGLSQQAANNRLKQLVKNGALVRQRVVPERGGKEFLYAVPAPD